MMCVKCGQDTKVIRTQDILSIKTSRRRECLHCGHRFWTIEVPVRAVRSNFAKGFEVSTRKSIALRERDIKIAQELHLGWQVLAQRHSLTKTAVYLAAKRGRSYMKSG